MKSNAFVPLLFSVPLLACPGASSAPAEDSGSSAAIYADGFASFVDRCFGAPFPPATVESDAQLHLRYSPELDAAYRACGEALKSAPCESAPPACDALDAVGRGAPGTACHFGSECTSGQCTSGDDGSCGTCREILPAGASCANGPYCTPPNVCGAGPNGTRICRERPRRAGASCSAPSDCEGTCANGTCVTVTAKLNEKCNGFAGPRCGDGLWCRNDTCAPRPQKGMPCEGACATGLVCDRTCREPRAPQADGARCAVAAECTSAICTNRVCAPVPPIGQPCVVVCEKGAYCDYAGATIVCRAITPTCN